MVMLIQVTGSWCDEDGMEFVSRPKQSASRLKIRPRRQTSRDSWEAGRRHQRRAAPANLSVHRKVRKSSKS